jgi:hypothetical protein
MAEHRRSVDAAWVRKLQGYVHLVRENGLAGLSKTLTGCKDASARCESCSYRSINAAVTFELG